MFINQDTLTIPEITFWFTNANAVCHSKKKQSEEEYANTLKEIASCNSIDSFWNVYQHLKHTNQLDEGISFQVFKKGIKPTWECEANRNGGKFSFYVRKDITNLIWEEVLIAFAGGVLPHYEHVNGISVKVGKDCDMICIWFGEFNKVKCVQMRDDFKMFLQIPQCVNVKLVSFERMK